MKTINRITAFQSNGSRIVSQNKTTEDDTEAIKRRFLAALRKDARHCETLRQIVEDAADNGVEPDELIDWGLEAGFSESYIRSTLSSVRIREGVRKRKPGGGRKLPREAITVAHYAQKQFGDNAAALLLAAYRWLKRKEKEV